MLLVMQILENQSITCSLCYHCFWFFFTFPFVLLQPSKIFLIPLQLLTGHPMSHFFRSEHFSKPIFLSLADSEIPKPIHVPSATHWPSCWQPFTCTLTEGPKHSSIKRCASPCKIPLIVACSIYTGIEDLCFHLLTFNHLQPSNRTASSLMPSKAMNKATA